MLSDWYSIELGEWLTSKSSSYFKPLELRRVPQNPVLFLDDPDVWYDAVPSDGVGSALMALENRPMKREMPFPLLSTSPEAEVRDAGVLLPCTALRALTHDSAEPAGRGTRIRFRL